MAFELLEKRWQHLLFTKRHQQSFLEDLSSLVEDGVPANQAIQTIFEISSGITKQVSKEILKKVAEGQPLADGMMKWFSRPIVEIIRAGESSGTLVGTLNAAAKSLGRQTSAIGEVIAAVLYPLVVLCLALVVLVFVKSSVLDNFADIKAVNLWPSIGQELFYLATFIKYWWWAAVIFIVGIFFAIGFMLRVTTGDVRIIIDKIPLLSLYRESTSSRFMETLGLLVTNGVILKKALTIMQKDAGPYLAWHILMMEYRLSGGRDNIAEVLDTNLLKKADIVRLKVVSKGKGFSEALMSLGAKASIHCSATIERSAKIVGGLLLASGAIMAATLVLGIYTVGSAIAT